MDGLRGEGKEVDWVDIWLEGRLNKKKKVKSIENLKEMDLILIVLSSFNNEVRDDCLRMIK